MICYVSLLDFSSKRHEIPIHIPNYKGTEEDNRSAEELARKQFDRPTKLIGLFWGEELRMNTKVFLKAPTKAILYSTAKLRKEVIVGSGKHTIVGMHSNKFNEIWVDLKLGNETFPIIVETDCGKTPIGKALEIVKEYG